MILIDTHCHIHDSEFFTTEAAELALAGAVQAGVGQLICVATSLEDSKAAIAFAHAHPENCWASVGIHPHEAVKFTEAEIADQIAELTKLAEDQKVVAIGETGFDFYYNDKHEVLVKQEQLLRGQIEVALTHNLPLSFHVREGFDEFWRVFESYENVAGVLHSFTDSKVNAERGLKNGLSFGINGIATFTTHTWQRDLFKNLPLEKIVLETDSPFLTPVPKRGTINLPENVTYITKFMAELRGEDADTIAKCTSVNARKLFGLS